MLRVLFILGLFLSLSFGASNLKIATYNVENLFDDKIDGSEYKDFKNGSWGAKQYSHKLNQIATVLLDLDADIIALQEIENEGVLKALAQKSGYKYYSFATLDRFSPVGLGFLSRVSLTKSQKFSPNGVKTRPILMICVDFDNLCLFNAHLPAHKNSDLDRKNAAKALITAASNHQKSVVLGDLNSELGYKFLLNDLKGYTNLWKIENNALKGKKSIDHILLSDDLLKNADLSYKKSSFDVFGPRFRASDHKPLFATLISLNAASIAKTASLAATNVSPQASKAQLNIKVAKSVDEIYSLDLNPAKITLTASFCDNKGCALSDSNGRGIYAYKLSANEGDEITLIAHKTSIYKGNLQLNGYQIQDIKKSSATPKYANLQGARSGDVVFIKALDIKNGYAKIDNKSYKIYSLSGKKQGKQKAQKAMFWIYNNEPELIIK